MLSVYPPGKNKKHKGICAQSDYIGCEGHADEEASCILLLKRWE